MLVINQNNIFSQRIQNATINIPLLHAMCVRFIIMCVFFVLSDRHGLVMVNEPVAFAQCAMLLLLEHKVFCANCYVIRYAKCSRNFIWFVQPRSKWKKYRRCIHAFDLPPLNFQIKTKLKPREIVFATRTHTRCKHTTTGVVLAKQKQKCTCLLAHTIWIRGVMSCQHLFSFNHFIFESEVLSATWLLSKIEYHYYWPASNDCSDLFTSTTAATAATAAAATTTIFCQLTRNKYCGFLLLFFFNLGNTDKSHIFNGKMQRKKGKRFWWARADTDIQSHTLTHTHKSL